MSLTPIHQPTPPGAHRTMPPPASAPQIYTMLTAASQRHRQSAAWSSSITSRKCEDLPEVSANKGGRTGLYAMVVACFRPCLMPTALFLRHGGVLKILQCHGSSTVPADPRSPWIPESPLPAFGVKDTYKRGCVHGPMNVSPLAGVFDTDSSAHSTRHRTMPPPASAPQIYTLLTAASQRHRQSAAWSSSITSRKCEDLSEVSAKKVGRAGLYAMVVACFRPCLMPTALFLRHGGVLKILQCHGTTKVCRHGQERATPVRACRFIVGLSYERQSY